MLHAHELTFTHPRTKKEMTFSAPLPKDFQEDVEIFTRWEVIQGKR